VRVTRQRADPTPPCTHMMGHQPNPRLTPPPLYGHGVPCPLSTTPSCYSVPSVPPCFNFFSFRLPGCQARPFSSSQAPLTPPLPAVLRVRERGQGGEGCFAFHARRDALAKFDSTCTDTAHRVPRAAPSELPLCHEVERGLGGEVLNNHIGWFWQNRHTSRAAYPLSAHYAARCATIAKKPLAQQLKANS
jgi:hypothetical protein